MPKFEDIKMQFSIDDKRPRVMYGIYHFCFLM